MHLARKSYASDLVAPQVSLRQRFANGDPCGTPPILRTLLGPPNLRRGERFVFFGSRRGDASFLVNDQRPRAAGAHIDSKNVGGHDLVLPNRKVVWSGCGGTEFPGETVSVIGPRIVWHEGRLGESVRGVPG